MPHSLILNLTPASPMPVGYLSGRHLHALFLNLVSFVDRDLGTYLHDSKINKAFTLSPLQTKRYHSAKHYGLESHHSKPIPPGTPCWWRITLLDDTLFSQLTGLWLNLNPDHPWHLGPADLFITSILGTPQSTHPWANACTYQQLYDRASETETVITLSFATPTCFRQGHYDSCLPTRESVFNSLLKRWNTYSNLPFETVNLESLYPSFVSLKTIIVPDSRSKFIGIVGEATYRSFGEVSPENLKQINTLADYALYCGIGRKTTMGMGMTRRFNAKS